MRLPSSNHPQAGLPKSPSSANLLPSRSFRRHRSHRGFPPSKVMFTAVSLGVFDRLEVSPFSAALLAAELGVEPDPLERLLDACAGLKLLRRSGATYRNEPVASTYLCRNSEHALTGYILYSNNVLFRMWVTSKMRCAKARHAGNRPLALKAESSITSSAQKRRNRLFSRGCTASDS